MEPNAEGAPIAKAGFVAAALWVLGVGARFAFQLCIGGLALAGKNLTRSSFIEG